MWKQNLDYLLFTLVTVSAGFQQNLDLDFPEYTPLQKCFKTQNMQELILQLKNMALNNRYFYDQQEMGLCNGKQEYFRYRMHCSKREVKSGLSRILKKGYGMCQQKRIHCFHIILWN